MNLNINLLKFFGRTIPLVFILFSQNIIMQGQKTKSTEFLKETKNEYIIINKKSRLVIRKEEWKLSLMGEDGTIHFREGKAPAFLIDNKWVSLSRVDKIISQDVKQLTFQASLSNGEKMLVEVKSLNDFSFNLILKSEKNNISSVRGNTFLNPVEEVYGFGEMWNGHVAQRGQSFELWDKGGTPDECAYMPYYVSTNNYAFFINYGGLVKFDVGQTNATELVFQAPASFLDITLVSASSIASSVQNFLSITGMPARPPKWAFKPWFWLIKDPLQPDSLMNSLRGEHFMVLLDKLKELDIPVGVTWFEPPWQDGRTSFIPNPQFSPDLKGLIKRINERGVKALAWTVPYTTNTSSNWREAVEKGYLVRKPAGKKIDEKFTITSSGELEGNFYTFIDFFNPEAVKWWQNQIEKSIDLGLQGYKLDAGQDLPKDAILFGGLKGSDVHNSYALEYNKVYYNALKNKLGDDFLMIPRAAWIGSASFTNFKWPGDLSLSFEKNGLPSTVYSSLSLALSGIPFVSTDIGGFSGKIPSEHVWIRWAQFGAFLPGMQTLHMPWWYSGEAIAHFRYLTWLHTDLVPLWISLANEAHFKGTPIIRPLVWSYQNDLECWRVDDEFTVGESILVAPITNAEPGRAIYLPSGLWYDFWDDSKTYKGPLKFNWSEPGPGGMYKFPVFVKGGAIIPMEISNSVTGFGSTESVGYVTFAIWPEINGTNTFELNDTEVAVKISYEWGKKSLIRVSWSKTPRNYILRINIPDGFKPVKVNGKGGTSLYSFKNETEFKAEKKDGWYYDSPGRKILIKINNNITDQTNSVFITLN